MPPRGFESDPRRMPFLGHLAELRLVLIHSAIFVTLGMIGAWAVSGHLLDWVIRRLGVAEVQFLSPMEPFNARLKISAIVGCALALPFVALRLWAFIVPALHIRERRVIVPSAMATSFLFAGGVLFSVLMLSPVMMQLFLRFGTERVTAHLALGPLLSFVLQMALACGFLFQLPLVLALTTMLGMTTPQGLWRKWRHAVVAIFVIAAIVTPGDGPSQIVLAIPLILLYFVSVLVSYVIWRARARREHDVPAAPQDPDEGDDGGGNGTGPRGPGPETEQPLPRPPPAGTQSQDVPPLRGGEQHG